MLIKTAPWHGFFAYIVPDKIWAQGSFAINNYLYEVMIGIERKFEFAHEEDQRDGGIKIFFSEGDKRAWKEERELEARAYASIILNDHKRAAKAAVKEELDEEWL